jgi:hypothetical protein
VQLGRIVLAASRRQFSSQQRISPLPTAVAVESRHLKKCRLYDPRPACGCRRYSGCSGNPSGSTHARRPKMRAVLDASARKGTKSGPSPGWTGTARKVMTRPHRSRLKMRPL